MLWLTKCNTAGTVTQSRHGPPLGQTVRRHFWLYFLRQLQLSPPSCTDASTGNICIETRSSLPSYFLRESVDCCKYTRFVALAVSSSLHCRRPTLSSKSSSSKDASSVAAALEALQRSRNLLSTVLDELQVLCSIRYYSILGL